MLYCPIAIAGFKRLFSFLFCLVFSIRFRIGTSDAIDHDDITEILSDVLDNMQLNANSEGLEILQRCRVFWYLLERIFSDAPMSSCRR